MLLKKLTVVILFSLLTTHAYSKAESKNGRMDAASELNAVFYNNANCEDIDSSFASPTRYDGSSRPKNRNKGLHGGTDWTIKIGDSLLAIADGEVIHKGKGGQMEGKFLWLLHSPQQTGLPYWLYSKYQHLDKIPDIEIGTQVNVGQVIAIGGDTGTKGGHYKNIGYPHLHLGLKKTKRPQYKVKGSKLKVKKAIGTGVLYLFKNTNAVSKAFENIELQDDEVMISYVKEGKVIPEDAKLVWPIECK